MQSNLARVYSNQRRTPEAKALFEKAMAVAEKASGADSETVRQVLNLYTVFTANHVDKALAQKQAERLIQVTRKVLGPNSTELINAYVTKGQILAAQKQWPQLDDYIRDAVDKAVAEHGEQNTFVIQLLADFAKIYTGVERNQAAETLYRRIVGLSAKTLGEDHQFTVANYVLLANVLQRRQRMTMRSRSTPRRSHVGTRLSATPTNASTRSISATESRSGSGRASRRRSRPSVLR